MADPDIKPLIEFMESSSNKPSWQDISAYSPTTKQYWALWNSLHLRNGVLYRKFESEDGKTFRWQLVLPRSRIPEVLKELHGSPTGGHFGVMKTLHRVRERFCWGKVRADEEQWCKSCDACSARKGPKIRSRGSCIATMLEHPSNVSLSISWDLCQGLRSPHRSGGCNAALDIEIWGTSSTSFRSGRNFVSVVLKGVCELLGIDKTKTTPLHPQSDGMVERFNRTILNNLSLMISKNQQDWDQKVPLFLLAYRSAVHETTGYSPSQMLFGRDLRLPCDLLFGRPPDTPSSPEEYVQNLQARFEDVHNLARERINLRTEKMKTRYDTKATGHQFKEGDKVWFYNPTRRKGLSPKLQSHWDGPYTILKIINDVVIRIRSLNVRSERGKKPVSAEAIEKVALQVEGDKSSNVLASTSVRRVAEALDLPRSNVQKLMRNILRYYPYKLQFVQELLPHDFETRHLFSLQFLARLEVDPEWPWNILWTDEVHFHLEGAGCPVTCSITGQRYASLLRNKIIPDLQARQCLSRIIFMQDGAPPHIKRCVTDVLKHHFTEERVISCQFRHRWAPRSPDLNPCDFWLWGHLKQLVSCEQPKNFT
ncbi:retrovirus-related Pol polyprotein from transposon 412 [Trichonephila clavipes]|nr:retrovirus-related Pol polyprotein from transposon 412 [Trichonephila clavipes]